MRLAVVVSWLVAALPLVAACTNAKPSEVTQPGRGTQPSIEAVYSGVVSMVGGEPRREEGMSPQTQKTT